MERDYQAEARALTGRLTDGEKALLLAGADFWHTEPLPRVSLPAVMLTDGPHGLRKQVGECDHVGLSDSVPATCFPTASCSACSFDPALLEEMGRALGEECRRERVAVLLGPGVNHKRSPLCGRNFEYFSEDPYLTGKLAAGYIRGVQSTGTAAALKHFACNSQEQNRQTSDSVVDERALREIYLRQFELAVREGAPRTIMTSYNRLNGVYTASSRWLMEEVARGEWGFRGLFMTDWGGMSDTVSGVAAGTDLEMPGVCRGGAQELLKALADGRLTRERLDSAAARVAELALRQRDAEKTPCPCDRNAHAALAERVARESAVLLKNDGVLPLRPGESVALLGSFAKRPRYQGSGSSRIHPYTLDNLFDALTERGAAPAYAEAFGPEETAPDEDKLAAAAALAAEKDAAVIVCGLPDSFESEGFDREHLRLPECQNELIRRVSAANPRTVVVLQCGSAVEMPWIDRPGAVLLLYLSGCRGGSACADLLLGRANPCGKLGETFPLSLADTPAAAYYRRDPYTAEYREGLYTGYRYYDAARKAVLFPFGHGLSYTSFAYSGLTVGDGAVTFTLENTGPVPGRETAQVYILKNGFKQLKGFQKIGLAPGEKQTVAVPLDDRAFAYWNTDVHDWREEGGEYTLCVGSSSRDLRLTAAVRRPAGTPAPAYIDGTKPVSREAFAGLCGVRLPAERRKRPFTPDSPVQDLQETAAGRAFVKLLRKAVGRALGGENPDRMAERTVTEMPIRFMGMSGLLTKQQLDGLLEIFNGRVLRGARALAKGKRDERV